MANGLTYIETPKLERIIGCLGDFSVLGMCAELMHDHKITVPHRLTIFVEDPTAKPEEISFQMEQARRSFPLFTILGYRRVPDDLWQERPK